MNENLGSWLKRLQSVRDDELEKELRNYALAGQINDKKYHLAFSSYGVMRWLSNLPLKILRYGAPGPETVPDTALNAIRWDAVIMFAGYTAFVYMRSEHLEDGLNQIQEHSKLSVFRDFLSKKGGGGTNGQHIRNALSHGKFSTSDDLEEITFEDMDWKATIKVNDFMELCREVFRFYGAAFRAKN